MIVIDVGSATHGSDASVPYLVDQFKPRLLIGLDPAQATQKYLYAGAQVDLLQVAAWTYDGTVGFVVAGLGGHVDPSNRQVYHCVDLARFIAALDGPKVLKVDAEGAEYTLIPHLVENDADLMLDLALIEWHCEVCGIGGNGRHREFCNGDHVAWEERRQRIEGMLRCETGEWNL